MKDSETRSALMSCLTVTSDGVVLNLRVQPRASKSEILGLRGTSIKAKVTAPPADGRANEAVLDLLAATLEVKRAQLSLVGGPKAHDKRILVRGLQAEDIIARLADHLHKRDRFDHET